MLPQNVGYLIQDAEGVILLMCGLLEPFLKNLDNGLAFVKLVDGEIQVCKLQV